jgi:protein disulfide-isomerase-like protein
MKNKNISGMLAAVDATKERDVSNRYGIKGYPTLKYFVNGELKFDVKYRETDSIVKFMKNPEEPTVVEEEKEVLWEDEDTHVVFLNDGTFKSFLKKKKHVLVMFYAPWCGHCKRTKPEFVEAAEKFKDDSKVELAAVDCTKHTGVCSAYDVKGYPTIKYFSYLKTYREYNGDRQAEDFIQFLMNPDQPAVKRTVEEKVVPFNSEKVMILDEKNFDATLNREKLVFILFHSK